MTGTLWSKGEATEAFVLEFTVSAEDLSSDQGILHFDAIASAAHARMLGEVGLLSPSDTRALVEGLKEIVGRIARGEMCLSREIEDCHTAIEIFLTDRCGEAGKRIHLGRSRNDQVLVAMRLFLRDLVITAVQGLVDLAETFVARFSEIGAIEMPGYTHFQRAMPMSVGMWLHAFLEQQLELIAEGDRMLDFLGANPLGAAAGFGTPLPLDRARTAELLGFSRVQRSPIDAQNSRGRYERRTAQWLAEIAGMAEKIASDLILLSTAEFGFFTLPREFTTGSSIMPQKHNPDCLELTRARAAIARAAVYELDALCAKLPSHYHRDFQYTKTPVIRAREAVFPVLKLLPMIINRLQVNRDAIERALDSDLYATYAAFRLVEQGSTFRDAYRTIAAEKIGRAHV